MSPGSYAEHASAAGTMLAAAREELNLSVSDVARQLKLSPAQVEALERGEYDRLPGRVFVRGFLRNYAKLLGLDPLPLLRSIEGDMPPVAVPVERPASAQVVMPREQPARWPLYAALLAIAVVGALAIYEFGFNDKAQTESVEAMPSPAGAPGPTGNDQPTPFASSQPAQGAAGQPVTVVASGTQGTIGPATNAGRAVGGEAASAFLQPGSVATASERELHFRFQEDSWVEVRNRNDKVIFSKLNRAGSEYRVQAAPPVKLVVGNAAGVKLTYGERTIDLTPHTGVSVARLTLE